MATIEVKRKVIERYPYYYVREYAFYRDGKEIAKQFLDKAGAITKTTGRIPDGMVYEHYIDGQIMIEWPYEQGRVEGTAKMYYEGGRLLKEVEYKGGIREGSCKEFDTSGALKIACSYKHGLLDGPVLYYDAHGKLLRTDTYRNGHTETQHAIERGKTTGEIVRESTATYPNGRTSEYTFYLHDREIAKQFLNAVGQVERTTGRIPDGMVREFYPSGFLRCEWNYRNGILEGPARLYHENGNVRTELSFKNGAKDGEIRSYYECGIIEAVSYFHQGTHLSTKNYME